MKDYILTNEVKTGTLADAASEISKVAVSAIGISAGVIGLWAVTCLSSAFMSEGGPVALVKSFFSAVSGTM